MMALERQDRGMPLQELLAGFTDGFVPDLRVTELARDSRQVVPGALFLACRGARNHGAAFVDQAVERGAAAVAWEPSPGIDPPGVPPNVALVAVDGLADRAGLIADRFFEQPSRELFLAGVTGTNGKTTCAWLLAQALSQSTHPAGYIGTLGHGTFGHIRAGTHTTPDSVSMHRLLAGFRAQSARAAAVEVSSHALDQGRVNGVVFDVALFTNLSHEHLDYHGTMAAYGEAKRRLFMLPELRTAVINADDEFGRELLRTCQSKGVETVAFTRRPGNPPVPADHVLALAGMTRLPDGMRLDYDSHRGTVTVDTRLIGDFNAENLGLVLAALIASGMSPDEAGSRLAGAVSVPGRMEVFTGAGRPVLVVDYAHTPDALRAALAAARGHVRGRLFCVFGCGGDRDRDKRPKMGEAAVAGADRVIVTDDNPRTEAPEAIVRDILAGAGSGRSLEVLHNRAEAIEKAFAEAGPDDLVLIAGKGHEETQVVDNVRRPFSDRAIARRLSEEGGP